MDKLVKWNGAKFIFNRFEKFSNEKKWKKCWDSEQTNLIEFKVHESIYILMYWIESFTLQSVIRENGACLARVERRVLKTYGKCLSNLFYKFVSLFRCSMKHFCEKYLKYDIRSVEFSKKKPVHTKEGFC